VFKTGQQASGVPRGEKKRAKKRKK